MIVAILLAQALAHPLSPASPVRVLPVAPESIQPGTGRLAPFINVRAAPYFAPCDGVNDDQPAFALAIAGLPSTGGTIDARSCSAAKLSSSLTINKSGLTFNLPCGAVSLGTNQIVIPVGIHNVAVIGCAPYGAPTAGVAGTNITYTGTGTAIVVGDSTADTQGFVMQDVTVLINGAGTAAIGLQLNRVQSYHLVRPRVAGLLTASTQVLLDLEGFTNFTGGQVDSPFFSNGNTAVLFGKNANANTLVGGQYLMPGLGTGTVFAFTGAAGGFVNGNAIFGGNAENCNKVLDFDRASHNQVFGLRSESCTTIVNATNNSNNNMAWIDGAILTNINLVDNGLHNTFQTTANVGMTTGTTVALTGQTANLAAQNLFQFATPGEYLVCATARTTTSGTGTVATLNILWTDEGGAKTDAVGTWALNSVTVTGQINKCEYIHAVSSSAIQVSVTAGTYGTSVYAITATVERVN